MTQSTVKNFNLLERELMENFAPMLAHEWEKSQSRVIYPVYAQPKLNGMRCVSVESGFWSRTGKSIVSMPALLSETKKYFPDLALDGELYSDTLCFEDTISVARKSVNINEGTAVKYWVYDAYMSHTPFKERFEHLKRRFAEVAPIRIRLVATFECPTPEAVTKYLNFFIEAGYEGAILRNPCGDYEVGKRSYNLLKLKLWKDMEVKVVGFERGAGRNYSRLGALVCELPHTQGLQVRVGTGLSDVDRETIWNNSEEYLERVCTIKYQELTNAGIPRFPSFLTWREEE